MKHELLEEIWRVREEISSECGHDVSKLAELLRRKETDYGHRLARLPVVRRSKRQGTVLREGPPSYPDKPEGNA